MINDAPIPAGSSLEFLSGNKVVLQTTDVVKIDCSSSAGVDATLSIMEITLMSYIGKKPVDFNDVTEAQTFTVTGDLTVDTDTLFVDSTNNRVGIGTTSPQAGTGLHIKTGASGATPNGDLIIEDDANVKILLSCPANTAQIHFGDDAANNVGKLEYIHSSNSMTFSTDATERMRITSGGDVGVGTTTPSSDISGTATVVEIADNNCASIALNNTGASTKFEIASLAADALTFRDNGTERMRVDNSGKLLMAKVLPHKIQQELIISATDGVRATVDQNVAAILNRTTDDGNIALFRKDGTTVGSIANNSTNKVNGVGALELSENGTTRVFVDGGGFFPFLDNTYDIGSSSLSLMTSLPPTKLFNLDQTMKQQIASLTKQRLQPQKLLANCLKHLSGMIVLRRKVKMPEHTQVTLHRKLNLL